MDGYAVEIKCHQSDEPGMRHLRFTIARAHVKPTCSAGEQELANLKDRKSKDPAVLVNVCHAPSRVWIEQD